MGFNRSQAAFLKHVENLAINSSLRGWLPDDLGQRVRPFPDTQLQLRGFQWGHEGAIKLLFIPA